MVLDSDLPLIIGNFSNFTSRKAKRNRILSCTLCCTISKEKKKTTLTLGMIQGHTGQICRSG